MLDVISPTFGKWCEPTEYRVSKSTCEEWGIGMMKTHGSPHTLKGYRDERNVTD